MVLRVGSPKGIIENEVGKKYKEFLRCNILFK
jgi:hypothetical protein